jgi:hypothetical protein
LYAGNMANFGQNGEKTWTKKASEHGRAT